MQADRVFKEKNGGQDDSRFALFPLILLLVDLLSLVFDYRDSLNWIKGDRSVAGKEAEKK